MLLRELQQFLDCRDENAWHSIPTGHVQPFEKLAQVSPSLACACQLTASVSLLCDRGVLNEGVATSSGNVVTFIGYTAHLSWYLAAKIRIAPKFAVVLGKGKLGSQTVGLQLERVEFGMGAVMKTGLVHRHVLRLYQASCEVL